MISFKSTYIQYIKSILLHSPKMSSKVRMQLLRSKICTSIFPLIISVFLIKQVWIKFLRLLIWPLNQLWNHILPLYTWCLLQVFIFYSLTSIHICLHLFLKVVTSDALNFAVLLLCLLRNLMHQTLPQLLSMWEHDAEIPFNFF